MRDDTDFVRIHPDVISAHDGLTGSDLSSIHHWDNPAIQMVVTRTK